MFPTYQQQTFCIDQYIILSTYYNLNIYYVPNVSTANAEDIKEL